MLGIKANIFVANDVSMQLAVKLEIGDSVKSTVSDFSKR